MPPVSARMDALLLEIKAKETNLGEDFDTKLHTGALLAITFSREKSEDVEFLLSALEKRKLISRKPGNPSVCNITVDGYAAVDELTRGTAPSEKAFVAMWFDENMDAPFSDGLSKGIRDAGYDPIRIDEKEHINRIEDEIMAEIRSSAFVVADFTGHRGGVYFEAGFALGLGIPLFWTCRESDKDDRHFDIEHYSTIFWKETELEELARQLKSKIESVLGKGPVTPLDPESTRIGS